VTNQELVSENKNVQNLAEPRVLEIAVSTVESLHAALEGGADRIELCAALSTGGLTPDQTFIEYSVSLCKQFRVPIAIMIRPRPGSFVYDNRESNLMLRSIAVARAADASALVSGALLPNGRIDPVLTQRLVEAAQGLPLTFHRAFDESPEQTEDLHLLHQIGVQRLLTGGGRGPATPAGLQRLAQHNQNRITLIAAGGLRPSSLSPLLEIPGLREFHSAATSAVTQAVSKDSHHYAADPQADAATVRALKKMLE